MFQNVGIGSFITKLLFLIILTDKFHWNNGEGDSTMTYNSTTEAPIGTNGTGHSDSKDPIGVSGTGSKGQRIFPTDPETVKHIRCAKRTLESHHYNRLVPPNINREMLKEKGIDCENGSNDECTITVVNKLDLLQIKEIDEEMGNVRMLMVFRQYWTDKRLVQPAEFNDDCPRILEVNNQSASYDPEYIATKVWLPDTYIHGIRDIYKPEILMKAQTFGVNPKGRIKFTMFGVFTLSCPMSFQNFPMDVQYCPIYLESWRLREKFQKLAWAKKRPIGIQKAYSLDQFKLDVRVTDDHHIVYSTGNFSQLGVVLIFSRELQFYILQIYFPTVLFIIISWLTFIIPPTYAQGRIILTITTMLTLAALYSLVGMHSPSTSYPKAIDVWMFVCLTFVFAAVVDCLVDIRLLFVSSQSYKKQKLGFLTPVSVALIENRRVFAEFFGGGDDGGPNGSSGGGSGEATATPSEFFDVTSRQDVTAAPSSSTPGRSILRSPSATEQRSSATTGVNFAAEPAVSEAPPSPSPSSEPETAPAQTTEERWNRWAEAFERYSILLYPLAFLLFNVCYWSYYLNAAEPPEKLVEHMKRGFTPEPIVIDYLDEGELHA